MTVSRWNAFALMAGLAAALGFAIWQDRAGAQASEALAASLQREAALMSQVAGLDNQIEHLGADWVRGRRRSSGSGLGMGTGAPTESGDRPAMSVAEARAARALRANLDLRYHSFLAKLGLSSDQIERWETAAVAHNQRLQDIAIAAADQGLSPTNPGIVALRQAETDEWNSQDDELLGTDGAAQLRQFARTAPAAGIASELAGHVFASDAPLTTAQGAQLTQILANSSATYQQGATASVDSIDWNAAMEQAQGVLSAAQLEALQAISVNHQVRHQLQQRVAALLKQP